MSLSGTFLSGQKVSAKPSCLCGRTVVPFVVEAKRLGKREKVRAKHRSQRRRGQDGTAERPRLAVYRSNNNIYAQVIDDAAGHTLAAISTISKSVKEGLENGLGANKAAAQHVGKLLAEQCKSKNIEKVFFDRGGLQYHGRVQALAEGAREGGLQF